MAKRQKVLKVFPSSYAFKTYRGDVDRQFGRGNLRFHLVRKGKRIGLKNVTFTKQGREIYSYFNRQFDVVKGIAERFTGAKLTTVGRLRAIGAFPRLIPLFPKRISKAVLAKHPRRLYALT
jgi:hypothetical protein